MLEGRAWEERARRECTEGIEWEGSRTDGWEAANWVVEGCWKGSVGEFEDLESGEKGVFNTALDCPFDMADALAGGNRGNLK